MPKQVRHDDTNYIKIMLNRILSPQLKQPEKVQIPEPVKIILPNGIPLFILNSGTQEVCKIEFLFGAGSLFESNPLVAAATNELIDEGTKNKSSVQVAEIFDFYGAYLQTECTSDWASVSLFTLNKFLTPTMELMREVITEPAFPEKELETFVVQGKQRLTVSEEKVDYLARRNFSTALFGSNHAYGFAKKMSDYDLVKPEQLASFHNQFYKNGVNAIIVAGYLTDEQQNNLITQLGQVDVKYAAVDFYKLPSPSPFVKQNLHIEKEGAVQNAIRIGRTMFNRTHADYPKFTVLNTILGGYFGSRLMSNIREDKGYTYGIGSGLASMQQSGYFYIATEVGADVCKAAINEINFEIEKLQQDLVPDDELNLVRNYLAGSFQRSIDGSFALADRYKSVLTYGLGSTYFYNYLSVLKTITSEELRTLAQQYLSAEMLSQVTAGKKF